MFQYFIDYSPSLYLYSLISTASWVFSYSVLPIPYTPISQTTLHTWNKFYIYNRFHKVMSLIQKCSKCLYHSANIVNTNISQHTHKNFEFSIHQVWILLLEASIDNNREYYDDKMKKLMEILHLYLTSTLKLYTIYSISTEFLPQKMMLKMMDFWKSPSQHSKTSLPSLTHKVF